MISLPSPTRNPLITDMVAASHRTGQTFRVSDYSRGRSAALPPRARAWGAFVIIVTTTLGELEAAAGRGLTGGGSILPMSDVIRLARHAHHYPAIFEPGKALALYHTKRLASPAQRIVLYAKDRGCTAPGCTVPGYYSEVHHVVGYAVCGCTDVNNLAFG